MNASLTNIEELDLEILVNIDDLFDVIRFCNINRYASNLCHKMWLKRAQNENVVERDLEKLAKIEDYQFDVNYFCSINSYTHYLCDFKKTWLKRIDDEKLMFYPQEYYEIPSIKNTNWFNMYLSLKMNKKIIQNMVSNGVNDRDYVVTFNLKNGSVMDIHYVKGRNIVTLHKNNNSTFPYFWNLPKEIIPLFYYNVIKNITYHYL